MLFTKKCSHTHLLMIALYTSFSEKSQESVNKEHPLKLYCAWKGHPIQTWVRSPRLRSRSEAEALIKSRSWSRSRSFDILKPRSWSRSFGLKCFGFVKPKPKLKQLRTHVWSHLVHRIHPDCLTLTISCQLSCSNTSISITLPKNRGHRELNSSILFNV